MTKTWDYKHAEHVSQLYQLEPSTIAIRSFDLVPDFVMSLLPCRRRVDPRSVRLWHEVETSNLNIRTFHQHYITSQDVRTQEQGIDIACIVCIALRADHRLETKDREHQQRSRSGARYNEAIGRV